MLMLRGPSLTLEPLKLSWISQWNLITIKIEKLVASIDVLFSISSYRLGIFGHQKRINTEDTIWNQVWYSIGALKLKQFLWWVYEGHLVVNKI